MNQTAIERVHSLWQDSRSPIPFRDVLEACGVTEPAIAAEIVRIDQLYRWETAAPMTVEDYLDAFPIWRENTELILEFTAGEFQARLKVQHLPNAGEYAERFPDLESDVRQKLSGLSTNHQQSTSPDNGIRSSLDRIFDFDDVCDAFEQVWRESSNAPFIESWVLHGHRDDRLQLLKELLRIELCVRMERRESPTLDEYRQRFPKHWPFHDVLQDWEQHPHDYILMGVPSIRPSGPKEIEPTIIAQPTHVGNRSGSLTLDGTQRIGHFRLLKQLGRGAFGRVYRAHDEQLDRAVAIKVPRRSRFHSAEDADAYLAEARMVARLDHPGIVPVYQVGRSDDGLIYIVSRLIEGRSLNSIIKVQRLEFSNTAKLIAKVARALHYAHQNRVIHRDIKPANILLEDATGIPFVADFGLAMNEDDYLRQAGTIAGTPAYMSPEQARAEGHRLDGRSDQFSLGVVLYEMLSGKRPFRGHSDFETLHQVITVEPRPPRLLNETIPAELERICLKALSKRASDRYATAELMAEDLEAWLKPAAATTQKKADVQVVPRGLRSFDANDADYFLDLLPGTRNRDGLPESIAFWKQRIEETDPEKTFNVGIMLGPSGCGKSSLVKAGLIPHLSQQVTAVYLEATADETELRILRRLNAGLSFLSDSDSKTANHSKEQHASTGTNAHPSSDRSLSPSPTTLTETLLQLRRGRHQKVVIIIDQFEQWLHAHRADANADLVNALRQCDGVHVQAIVMIRDDFAMAAARFMQAVDVAILQGHNFATVDLFEVDHAKHVLIKFGQAFGKLPANSENLSAEESQFVSEVATGLSQDGKVVSVRLSLFAEMVKSKRWILETLQAVGGTDGIGVNFLEETFSSPKANPRHRLHGNAARLVLKSLLPELGTDIKGHMRSQQELLEASSYANRPADFADLLRILDGELRLITPTDPEGDTHSGERQGVSGVSPPSSASFASLSSSLSALRYFQLTHDYLVPSLREWLTRKQRETRKGRAELKLAERAAVWNAYKENKQLPTLLEWLQICFWTDKRRWNCTEQVLMRTTTRHHLIHWGSSLSALLIVSAVIGFLFQQQNQHNQKEKITLALDSLQKPLGPAVPMNIKKLEDIAQPEVIRTELQRRFTATTEPVEKLSLAFSLAAFGKVESTWLISQLDSIEDRDTANLIAALTHDSAGSIERLRQAAADCTTPDLYRRKARLALVALGIGDTTLPVDATEFEGRTDHGIRSYFIEEFPRWKFDSTSLIQTVKDSSSPALRSAVCLGWGQISVDQISDASKDQITQLANKWFALPDSSTHSATAWLLRQWNLPEPAVADAIQVMEGRNWYVNSQGTTFVLITPPPVTLQPLTDPIELYRKQLLELAQLPAEEQNQQSTRYQRATALYHTEQYELALAEFDALLKMEPDRLLPVTPGQPLLWRKPGGPMYGTPVPRSSLQRMRLLTLARLKQTEEATAALAEWRASDPDAFFLDYTESLVPLWLGQKVEAIQRLEKGLANVESADRTTLYNLARTAALFAANEVASAEEKRIWIDRAVTLLSHWISRDLADRSWMRNDPDLFVLHSEPTFIYLAAQRPDVPERPYWLANREVTRGEFEAFLNDANYEGAKPTAPEASDPDYSPTLLHPVQKVSWQDAVMFCNWLSSREGRTPAYRTSGKEKVRDYVGQEYEVDQWEMNETADGYRLPSQLEWEYACCAGSETTWSCGNEDSVLVHYCQMSPAKLTAICGQKLPNAWGLHDVHGNVREWCWGTGDPDNRQLCGGSFVVDATNAASVHSYQNLSFIRLIDNGFRVGRTLQPIHSTALPPAEGGAKSEK